MPMPDAASQPVNQKPWSVRYSRWIGLSIIVLILGLNFGISYYRNWEAAHEDRVRLDQCFKEKMVATTSPNIADVMCECGSAVPLGVEGIDSHYQSELATRLGFYKAIHTQYQFPSSICEIQDMLKVQSQPITINN